MLSAVWRISWRPFVHLRGLKPYWQALENFDRLPEPTRRLELGKRLLAQLRYFGNRSDALPEWREASRASSVDELWEIWPRLPIVTKSDLQTRFHPERLLRLEGVSGVASSTGGSTGEPTPYLHDRRMRKAMWAATLYYRWQMGWRPWVPMIVVWGSERDIGQRRSRWGKVKGHLQMQHLVDGYHLTRQTAEEVRRLIARYEAVTIYGFTSMLDFVARTLLDTGATPRPGGVLAAWNGGEMLYEDQSRRFARAFGVPILNYYGGRELSAMAFQPRAGAPLRVLRPLLYVDVVDDEGNPAEPGKTGRLIWTSTVCRGTPFLRFDVGDLGTFQPADRDSSGVARLSQLQGRSAGLITLKDGTRLNCLFWNHLFKDFDAVKQFQVVYRRDQTVHVRLRGEGPSTDVESRLLSVLSPLFGANGVSVEWVERIPLTQQGKLEQVVRE